ncbi:MAG TPA: VanZ family protein [Macromonas sp.]|nr:VanZ family protein [Macromonas sp.]
MTLLGCSLGPALLGRRWLRALFWGSVLGVLVLSLLPTDRLPEFVFDWWDKAQHALGFAWLALCGRLAYPSRNVGLLLGLLALGAFIEFAQAATGWRQGDLADWCADALGALAVWGLFSCGAPNCSKTAE